LILGLVIFGVIFGVLDYFWVFYYFGLFWIIFDYFLNILDNLLNIILLCKISTPKGDNA